MDMDLKTLQLVKQNKEHQKSQLLLHLVVGQDNQQM